jgi:hypothetical protein
MNHVNHPEEGVGRISFRTCSHFPISENSKLLKSRDVAGRTGEAIDNALAKRR